MLCLSWSVEAFRWWVTTTTSTSTLNCEICKRLMFPFATFFDVLHFCEFAAKRISCLKDITHPAVCFCKQFISSFELTKLRQYFKQVQIRSKQICYYAGLTIFLRLLTVCSNDKFHIRGHRNKKTSKQKINK
jgi:hypothetical protein